MTLRRLTFIVRVFPVWTLPHDRAWHLSRGPVQYLGRAVFDRPLEYPVSVALAAVAAAQFYYAAGAALLLAVAFLLVSQSFALGGVFSVALAGLIARKFIRRHWLAMRLAVALNITGGRGEVLFWAKRLADDTGLDRGRARALLEFWLETTPRG
jgi:hypothetical protein